MSVETQPGRNGQRIAKLEAIPISIPYRHPGGQTGFGGRSWPTIDLLLVRLTTETGLVGYGEAFGYNIIPATRATLLDVIAPLVTGRDPTDIRGLLSHLHRTLHLFGRGGVLRYALSGLELACWDLLGKSLGAPLHRLLGAAPRPLPAYASLLRYSDAVTVARATEEVVGKGYDLVKLHETDPEVVQAARDAGGDQFGLAVDVNCAWSPAQAVTALNRMRPAGLSWIEEPLWPPEDAEALARLRSALPDIPVAAGENAATPREAAELVTGAAVDILQPSITKIGGLLDQLLVTEAALSANVRVAPHSPYFGPGLLATLHLATVLPDPWVEWLYCTLEEPLYQVPVEPVEGFFRIPSGPGLGADPSEAVIRRYRTDLS